MCKRTFEFIILLAPGYRLAMFSSVRKQGTPYASSLLLAMLASMTLSNPWKTIISSRSCIIELDELYNVSATRRHFDVQFFVTVNEFVAHAVIRGIFLGIDPIGT